MDQRVLEAVDAYKKDKQAEEKLRKKASDQRAVDNRSRDATNRARTQDNRSRRIRKEQARVARLKARAALPKARPAVDPAPTSTPRTPRERIRSAVDPRFDCLINLSLEEARRASSVSVERARLRRAGIIS